MFKISDHYDGRVFHNSDRISHSFYEFLKWIYSRRSEQWPSDRVSIPQPKPVASVKNGISVTYINHATVLLQMDGLNILTDPIWSLRCSPVQFVGPKRYQDPGIAFDNLPPINAVLISHNHYDHLDTITVKKLIKKHNPIFLIGIGNEKFFKNLHAKVYFLDWWDKIQISSSVIAHFVPAQHFSGRSLFDRDKSLWGGFMLETHVGRIFFAGDSGYGAHFSNIAKCVGSPKLALLPIGAYRPRWFMSHVHMEPDEAVCAHIDLKAEFSMGIHFGTFKLADEGIDEPKVDLEKSLVKYNIHKEKFWVPEFGETRIIE